MIPFSYAVLAWLLSIAAAVAALIGLCSAAVVTSAAGRRLGDGLLRGAAFGAAAFLIVFVISALTPVPRNTVVTYLPGGTKMTSTMNRFQHPIVLSYAAAAFVPAALTLWHIRRRR